MKAEDSLREPSNGAALTVYFDGACPLCRREIALYRDLGTAASIEYCDVSQDDSCLPADVDRASARARFHVMDDAGRVHDGASAFVALWARLPGWRWLARIARLPGVTGVLELAYRAFLPLRPTLQRIVARRVGD